MVSDPNQPLAFTISTIGAIRREYGNAFMESFAAQILAKARAELREFFPGKQFDIIPIMSKNLGQGPASDIPILDYAVVEI